MTHHREDTGAASGRSRRRYKPAKGSPGRPAWDRLTTEERELCDRWVDSEALTAAEFDRLNHDIRELSRDKRRWNLLLAALGYVSEVVAR